MRSAVLSLLSTSHCLLTLLYSYLFLVQLPSRYCIHIGNWYVHIHIYTHAYTHSSSLSHSTLNVYVEDYECADIIYGVFMFSFGCILASLKIKSYIWGIPSTYTLTHAHLYVSAHCHVLFDNIVKRQKIRKSKRIELWLIE